MFLSTANFVVLLPVAVCCDTEEREGEMKSTQDCFESCESSGTGIGWGPSEKKCKGNLPHFIPL
jgi:hypothetical protein